LTRPVLEFFERSGKHLNILQYIKPLEIPTGYVPNTTLDSYGYICILKSECRVEWKGG
jgi:hypothetical protein